ncbi:unnamed protein product [Rotaria sp. Silwood1]|nr:unnamed protein product [Rotaria sp. Silwood1]CAF3869191.1 unnamed protein product [Rotaria sp. Silwood1]CAF3926553.1 unnamed protein product [Rotaria sp. Silwood1]CAF4641378.1 unnamed protein product [Rotaria sp. Silwood1]CAF4943082.1 unnamed protein product [Rotaria sp. Silwood1]
MKRRSTETMSSLFNKFAFDDDYDKGTKDDIQMKNQIDIDCEDDDENEGTLELIYENDSNKSDYSNNDASQ